MALNTRQAKKLLTKKEQSHLTEANVNSVAAFRRTREEHRKMKERHPNSEPCWDCRLIAKKLGWEK